MSKDKSWKDRPELDEMREAVAKLAKARKRRQSAPDPAAARCRGEGRTAGE